MKRPTRTCTPRHQSHPTESDKDESREQQGGPDHCPSQLLDDELVGEMLRDVLVDLLEAKGRAADFTFFGCSAAALVVHLKPVKQTALMH